MNHEDAPSRPSADLPEIPAGAAPPPLADVGSRPSSVKAPTGPIATHNEDLPFPLPPDWFERKAKEQAAAAAKAAAAKAELEAQAAAAVAATKAEAGQPDGAVVRARPTAEMLRSVAQAASGEGRQEAYKSHVQSAEGFAAKGQWREAAAAYEAAARKAPSADIGADLAAKAVAARKRIGRLRRIVIAALVTGVLCGALGGGWWKFTRPPPPITATTQVVPPPRAVPDPVTENLSGTDKAKSYALMVQLRADYNDPDKPWSTVGKEAKAALTQPGVDLPIVKEMLARAERELLEQSRDLATIEGARVQDASGALSLASEFRTAHPRAQDEILRLPLAGRLMINDPPPGSLATYDGKDFSLASAGSAGGAAFCRDGRKAATLEVSAPGYIPISVEIPADPTITVKIVRAALIERPVWSSNGLSEAPTILQLGVGGGQVVMLEPHAVRTFRLTDGRPLSTLAVNSPIPGMPAGTYTWDALVETTATGVVLATSTGALCSASFTPAGLDKLTLITNTPFPVMSMVHGELVYRLNAPAQFVATTPHAPKAPAFGTPLADRLKIRNISEVYAISEDKQLWDASFTGNLPLFVLTHGEQVLVIDETSIHVLDQESKELKVIKLPGMRRGPVQALSKGSLLVIPMSDGMMVYRDAGGSEYQSLATDAVDRLAATDGDLLFALRASTLTLLQGTATGLAKRWSTDLPTGMEAVAVGLFGTMPWFLDNHSVLHALDGANHREVRRLRIAEGAMVAPTIADDHLVIADTMAGLKVYRLSGPQSPDAGKR